MRMEQGPWWDSYRHSFDMSKLLSKVILLNTLCIHTVIIDRKILYIFIIHYI